MNHLQTLADRSEINEVLLKYCRGIDRLDEPLVRSCFHDDAQINQGIYNGTVDTFIGNSFPRQRQLVSAAHCIHNVLIELSDDDAVSEAYASATERRQENGQLIDQLVGLRYVDHFTRGEGSKGWRIAKRTVVVDWTRSHVVDEGWLAGVDFERGKRNEDDLVYRQLKETFPAAR